MKSRAIDRFMPRGYAALCKDILSARNKGYSVVDFYGGEPLIFRYLKRLIRYTSLLGMSATLATNAMLFSSRKFSDNFFRGINLRGVRTSLHSLIPHVHDFVTQVPGSFVRTNQGIRNILRYTHCLSVNIVITRLNYQELPEIPRYLFDLGVRGIKFSALTVEGAGNIHEWLFISEKAAYPYIARAYKNSKKLGFLNVEGEHFSRAFAAKKEFSFVRFINSSDKR